MCLHKLEKDIKNRFKKCGTYMSLRAHRVIDSHTEGIINQINPPKKKLPIIVIIVNLKFVDLVSGRRRN